MPITTREAGPADADLLHDLAARTFPLAAPATTPRADVEAFIARQLSAGAFAKYLADPLRTLLIAEADGLPIGYAMLVAGPIADPDVAALVADAAGGRAAVELSKFYLLAESHGSGAAATLMAGTLSAAEKAGAAYCWLGVNEDNERAARFYAKHGFGLIGTKSFHVGETLFIDPVRGREV